MAGRIAQLYNYLTSAIILIMSTHKKNIINAAWYVVIIAFVGQIGPLIGYARTFWKGGSLNSAIETSAAKGELITCAIAILAAATFFLVKEYNSPAQINHRLMKSCLLLWTLVCGLVCILISVELLARNDMAFSSTLQRVVHWTSYILAMVTAFVLWSLEEWQTSASEETEKWIQQASAITAESTGSQTSTGLKV